MYQVLKICFKKAILDEIDFQQNICTLQYITCNMPEISVNTGKFSSCNQDFQRSFDILAI